ncbi:hypothetical protein OIU79_004020 [Salix purpurea]|uniref:Uncharacterized protein n=1 Tax=Salix purpurea TaxID=77065 RepID=A0A9Q0U983_SALPP|nr:hypothetical protein OIU79_004020 [Salix purpurea]
MSQPPPWVFKKQPISPWCYLTSAILHISFARDAVFGDDISFARDAVFAHEISFARDGVVATNLLSDAVVRYDISFRWAQLGHDTSFARDANVAADFLISHDAVFGDRATQLFGDRYLLSRDAVFSDDTSSATQLRRYLLRKMTHLSPRDFPIRHDAAFRRRYLLRCGTQLSPPISIGRDAACRCRYLLCVRRSLSPPISLDPPRRSFLGDDISFTRDAAIDDISFATDANVAADFIDPPRRQLFGDVYLLRCGRSCATKSPSRATELSLPNLLRATTQLFATDISFRDAFSVMISPLRRSDAFFLVRHH